MYQRPLICCNKIHCTGGYWRFPLWFAILWTLMVSFVLLFLIGWLVNSQMVGLVRGWNISKIQANVFYSLKDERETGTSLCQQNTTLLLVFSSRRAYYLSVKIHDPGYAGSPMRPR